MDQLTSFWCLNYYATTRENPKRLYIQYELQHEISNNVECATTKGSDQPVHTRSLIRAFASRLNILRVLSS